MITSSSAFFAETSRVFLGHLGLQAKQHEAHAFVEKRVDGTCRSGEQKEQNIDGHRAERHAVMRRQQAGQQIQKAGQHAEHEVLPKAEWQRNAGREDGQIQAHVVRRQNTIGAPDHP
ncbi:hypothetical protein OKW45_002478 [Paraburkholderia sp. WSM4175]